MGHRYYLYRYPRWLGVSVHHPRSVRWIHRLPSIRTRKFSPAGSAYSATRQQTEPIPEGLLLHSDHGHQYTSHGYAVFTQHAAITPSMSRRGNCWDNAPMENFFSHLKEEALRQFPTPTFEEA